MLTGLPSAPTPHTAVTPQGKHPDPYVAVRADDTEFNSVAGCFGSAGPRSYGDRALARERQYAIKTPSV